jgi:hypothetical protein
MEKVEILNREIRNVKILCSSVIRLLVKCNLSMCGPIGPSCTHLKMCFSSRGNLQIKVVEKNSSKYATLLYGIYFATVLRTVNTSFGSGSGSRSSGPINYGSGRIRIQSVPDETICFRIGAGSKSLKMIKY